MSTKRKRRRYRLRRCVVVAGLRFIVFICLGMVVFSMYERYRNDNEIEGLRKLKADNDFVSVSVAGETVGPETIEKLSEVNTDEGKERPEPEILEEYSELCSINPDMVGWLRIENTEINYPVVQNEDNEYYLHHDFYGEDSRYGTLFVKDIADVNTPGTNFIIYGHHMRNGSMFGNLDEYESESFFREHPIISFDTIFEKREYQVISVFRSKVYSEDEEAFKYYDFYQANSKSEFEDFYNNVKSLSEYDTKVEAEYGDTFLTLSTCAYHTKDGRFVVVAKRIR